jgi:hypothetical protein
LALAYSGEVVFGSAERGAGDIRPFTASAETGSDRVTRMQMEKSVAAN